MLITVDVHFTLNQERTAVYIQHNNRTVATWSPVRGVDPVTVFSEPLARAALEFWNEQHRH